MARCLTFLRSQDRRLIVALFAARTNSSLRNSGALVPTDRAHAAGTHTLLTYLPLTRFNGRALYRTHPKLYLRTIMGILTTRRDQRHTASAARRVGGYSELIRLSSERARSSGGVLTRNAATGQWTVKRRDG